MDPMPDNTMDGRAVAARGALLAGAAPSGEPATPPAGHAKGRNEMASVQSPVQSGLTAKRTTLAIAPATLWQTAAIAVTVLAICVAVIKTFDILLLLFFAVTLAEALRPLVNALERRHVPRAVGVLLIYAVGAVTIAVAGWLLAGPLLEQFRTMGRRLPQQLVALQQVAATLQQALATNADLAQLVANTEHSASIDIGTLAQALLAVPVATLSMPLAVILVLLVTLFWLTTADRWRPTLLSMLPTDARDGGGAILDELSSGLGGYTRGLIINSVLIGALTWLGLLLLGVPYPLLLGLASGFFQLVPLIGPWISGAVIALAALSSVGGPRAALAVLLFFAVQQLDSVVVIPLIMSRAARLNPLVTLLATIVGAVVLGFFGAVMAVPLAFVIQVLVARILVPWAQAKAKARQTAELG
jgi:predicted PurR-regulated permease PerM